MGPMTIMEAREIVLRVVSSWRQLCWEAANEKGPPQVIGYEERRALIENDVQALPALMTWAMLLTVDEKTTLGEVVEMLDELGLEAPDQETVRRLRHGG